MGKEKGKGKEKLYVYGHLGSKAAGVLGVGSQIDKDGHWSVRHPWMTAAVLALGGATGGATIGAVGAAGLAGAAAGGGTVSLVSTLK